MLYIHTCDTCDTAVISELLQLLLLLPQLVAVALQDLHGGALLGLLHHIISCHITSYGRYHIIV